MSYIYKMFYVFYFFKSLPCPYPNRSSLLLLAVSKDDSFF